MKITFNTTKWYKHAVWQGEYRPLMSEPGPNGTIAVVDTLGNPTFTRASLLIIPPKRHTVEWRVPTQTDRFIYDNNIIVLTASHDWTIERWVIIEDKVTP